MPFLKESGFSYARKGVKFIYKSCKYCGRMHEEGYVCKAKPTKHKRNTDAVKFRNSTIWQAKREAIKRRDNYLCQVCLRNLYNPQHQYQYEGLQAHHAIPILKRADLQLENSNVITLCSYHHAMADKNEISYEEIKKIIDEQEKNSPPPGYQLTKFKGRKHRRSRYIHTNGNFPRDFWKNAFKLR